MASAFEQLLGSPSRAMSSLGRLISHVLPNWLRPSGGISPAGTDPSIERGRPGVRLISPRRSRGLEAQGSGLDTKYPMVVAVGDVDRFRSGPYVRAVRSIQLALIGRPAQTTCPLGAGAEHALDRARAR